jgi:glycosyltransferase involved in cell wall biosynthesis
MLTSPPSLATGDDAIGSISVVVPAHNEEATIRQLVARTTASLRAAALPHELIIVSDGSTDRTNEILAELAPRTPGLRVLLLSRNLGQSAALDAGIQQSVGDAVIVIDADLQQPPEEIPRLVAELAKGFDLVSGTRTGRDESAVLRLLPSRIANWMLRRVTGCPIRDMGGFKCLRGDVARSIVLARGRHRLLPALVWLMGGSVSEVPVKAAPRAGGDSHYGLRRSIDVFFDILLMWFEASAGRRPFYLLGRIAIGLLAVDAVIVPVLLWDKFVNGVDMGTRPPFLVAIMFFLAALFVLAAGFILEILADANAGRRGTRGWRVRRVIEGPPLSALESAGDASDPAGPTIDETLEVPLDWPPGGSRA